MARGTPKSAKGNKRGASSGTKTGFVTVKKVVLTPGAKGGVKGKVW